MSEIEYVQKNLIFLFNLVGIQRVVLIDDKYDITLDTIIDLLPFLSPSGREELSKRLNLSLEIDSLDFSQSSDLVRMELDSLTKRQMQELYATLRIYANKKSDNITSEDTIAVLFSKFPFTPLTPSQWKQQEKDLLDEASTKKTLFLFDLKLSEGIDDEGMRIIEQIHASSYQGVICGLISNNFTPDKEYSTWKHFVELYKVDPSRFLLISKHHKSYKEAAQSIKLIVLNDKCNQLKLAASNIIKNSYANAQKLINELDIYDFEHIVFKTSFQEGVWELDTLFRLFNLYQRQEALKLAREANSLANTLASEIRDTSEIRFASTPPTRRVKEVRQAEIYEGFRDGLLNEYYLPLELGDIFSVSLVSPQHFILLGQPCDLMVRTNPPGERGSRSSGPKHEAMLVPLGTNSIKESITPKLDYFPLSSASDTYYVDFRKAFSVNLRVLDLCVYNQDGQARLFLDTECPSRVLLTWKLRYKLLQDYFRPCVQRYLELMTRVDAKELEDVIVKVLPLMANNQNINVVIERIDDKNTIKYDIKRVGRISKDYAAEILSKYASYNSRNAFEHDFGAS